MEKANFEKSQQETESFEITQRAELFTRELIEITHGATCAFCALRYVRFISKYPYEKRRTNKMKKDNLKNVLVRDSNPHIYILRKEKYPLDYRGIVDNFCSDK